MMTEILSKLNKFRQVTLKDVDRMKLLDRVDLKYVFTLDLLPEVLERLPDEYNLLTIEEKGISRYESHYFDTDNFQMYLNHHNGLMNRNKVRFRKYLDTGTMFFEIKHKTNKERTVKSRIEVNKDEISLNDQVQEMLLNQTGLEAGALSEVLIVNYNRISLIGKYSPERVTIDSGLQYDRYGKVLNFPGIVIAEIKLPKMTTSFFRKVMHDYHIVPLKISKYCMGMAILNPTLKSNNFKSKLLYVSRLSKQNN
ncbi:MAG TPA: polyphosphate polymerase domain-containing protein [Lentimicrobium sp.]|nr:polyphosphate polymerase domain-containing protein [Lentimicrobium sp.]